MSADADMTHRSNALFSAIVATVAASKERRLTVSEIARQVGAEVETIASCIALHRHFRAEAQKSEGRLEATLVVPVPPGFTVPTADDAIDEAALGL